MFAFPSYYFVFILILQGICAFHCIRKGTQKGWLLVIIFFPLVGCIIYFFAEILTDRHVKNVQSGVITTFNPSGKIRKLEKNLRFSDTFNNKVMLADAYLAAGQNDKAISLYESSLVGNFDENEYVLTQLILAYHNAKQFHKIIPIGKKLYHLPQFPRSKAHVYYTMALEITGDKTAAENEFKKMRSKYSNFEFRYQYALFMLRNNNVGEASQLLSEINEESGHLSPAEKRYNREWIGKAKEELRKMRAKV
jgi:hypothetical protein